MIHPSHQMYTTPMGFRACFNCMMCECHSDMSNECEHKPYDPDN